MLQTILKIFVILILFLRVSWAAQICDASKYETVMAIDFHENSPLPNGVHAVRPKASDSITLEHLKSPRLTSATKVIVRNAPEYISDGGKIRAEYSTLDSAKTPYKEGEDWIYKFSLMLAPDWIYDSSDSIYIVWQFKRVHGKPDSFLAVKRDDLILRVGPNELVKLLSPVPRGQWIDICFEIKWSTTPNGSIKISSKYLGKGSYQNLGEYNGPNMDTRDKKTYLKWGIYKPDNFEKSIAKTAVRTLYDSDIFILKK